MPKYTKADSIYRRQEKSKISGQGRAAINNRNSALTFERLVFANFGRDDYYITMEYAPEHLPAVRREVLRDWKRFRARLVKSGWPDVKYIYVPEHRHGAGRWHIHAVLGGTGGRIETAAAQIQQAWGKGFCYVRPILASFSEVGELARYLTKERPEVGDRGFIPSRGLLRPTVDSQRVPDSAVLTVPPEGFVMDSRAVKNEYGEYSYIKYYLMENGAADMTQYPKI